MVNAVNKTDEKKRKVIKALNEYLGIVTDACQKADICRATFYKWYKTDLAFKAQVDAIEDRVIDFVESCFYKKVQEGDVTAIIFFLKSKGKKRGWNEKSHIELSGNLGLTLPEEEQQIYDSSDVEKLEQIKDIVNR